MFTKCKYTLFTFHYSFQKRRTDVCYLHRSSVAWVHNLQNHLEIVPIPWQDMFATAATVICSCERHSSFPTRKACRRAFLCTFVIALFFFFLPEKNSNNRSVNWSKDSVQNSLHPEMPLRTNKPNVSTGCPSTTIGHQQHLFQFPEAIFKPLSRQRNTADISENKVPRLGDKIYFD